MAEKRPTALHPYQKYQQHTWTRGPNQ